MAWNWPKDEKQAHAAIGLMWKALGLYCKKYPKCTRLRCHEKAEATAQFFGLVRVDGYVTFMEHSWCKWDDRWILDMAASHVGICDVGDLIAQFSPVGSVYIPKALPRHCRPRKKEVGRLIKCLEAVKEDKRG